MSSLSVNQVSKKLNISVHKVRFYEDQGLFPDVIRDKNGKRLFTEESLEWVNLVLCLRSTGMPIADIKYFVELCKGGDSTIPERYNIILAQKKKAESDLEDMQKRLSAIQWKENWYKKIIEEKKMDLLIV